MRKIINYVFNIWNKFINLFKKNKIPPIAVFKTYINTIFSSNYKGITVSSLLTTVSTNSTYPNIPMSCSVIFTYNRNGYDNDITVSLSFNRNVNVNYPKHSLKTDIVYTPIQHLTPLEISTIFQDLPLLVSILENKIEIDYNNMYP